MGIYLSRIVLEGALVCSGGVSRDMIPDGSARTKVWAFEELKGIRFRSV